MADEKTTITQLNPKELEEIFNMNEDIATVAPVDNTKLDFTRTKLNEEDLNLSVIKTDKSKEIDKKDEDDKEKVEPVISTDEIQIADLDVKEEEDDFDKKSEKDLELAALEDLVKSEDFLLFDDGKELKDYTKKERIELIKANIDRIKEETEAKAPAEFFDALSPLMQMAFKYETDGGTDLKDFVSKLADFQEVSKLDITSEKDQEEVIRTYLRMQGDLNTQEIEEELTNIKDTPGALEKKAGLYKPKIEAKQQQIINKKLKDQESFKQKQDAAIVNYRKAVFDTINTGEINGIKLTKNNQGMLYEGLSQSVDGFREFFKTIPGIKTDYAHMAEIYWLAKDPKGYAEAKSSAKVAQTVADDFKKLKVAGQNKTTATTGEIEHNAPIKQNTIKKKPNLFARQQ